MKVISIFQLVLIGWLTCGSYTLAPLLLMINSKPSSQSWLSEKRITDNWGIVYILSRERFGEEIEPMWLTGNLEPSTV